MRALMRARIPLPVWKPHGDEVGFAVGGGFEYEIAARSEVDLDVRVTFKVPRFRTAIPRHQQI